MYIIIHFIILWGQIAIICTRNSSQQVLIGLFPNRKMQFLVGHEGQRPVTKLSWCSKHPISWTTTQCTIHVNLPTWSGRLDNLNARSQLKDYHNTWPSQDSIFRENSLVSRFILFERPSHDGEHLTMFDLKEPLIFHYFWHSCFLWWCHSCVFKDLKKEKSEFS